MGVKERREEGKGGEEDMQPRTIKVTETCQVIMFPWQHNLDSSLKVRRTCSKYDN